MASDYRERAHDAMRDDLGAAAFEVIMAFGYENQSAEEIAHRLGISRASFFRYLGSKDDVVITALLGPVDQFSAPLHESADRDFSDVWERLRFALEPAVAAVEEAPAEIRARLALTQASPALGAKLRRARVPQTEAIADALVSLGTTPFDAAVLAAATMAVLDRSWALWAVQDDTPFRSTLDDAFAAVRASTQPR